MRKGDWLNDKTMDNRKSTSRTTKEEFDEIQHLIATLCFPVESHEGDWQASSDKLVRFGDKAVNLLLYNWLENSAERDSPEKMKCGHRLREVLMKIIRTCEPSVKDTCQRLQALLIQLEAECRRIDRTS